MALTVPPDRPVVLYRDVHDLTSLQKAMDDANKMGAQLVVRMTGNVSFDSFKQDSRRSL